MMLSLPIQKLFCYITNIELLNGEGASSFRVYAEDASGKFYRFPVSDLKLVNAKSNVYALTFRLKDDLNLWQEQAINGDMLLSVTWRGLQSNRVRLGFGATGSAIKDDLGAVSGTAFREK